MSNAAAIRGRDIVCVGFADWETDLWTNQHHLMSRLARENRVLFVESLGLRRPQLAQRDLRRMLRRVRRSLKLRRPAGGPVVLSPLVLPFHRWRLVRRLNAHLLAIQVRRALRTLSFAEPILWAYVPQAEALLDTVTPALVVYHCVDDIAAQPGIDAASFRAAEERFVRRADLVLVSSRELERRLRPLASNLLYAPNVADIAHFAKSLEEGPTDAALAALAAPRIVFTGAVVATKLDVGLIVSLGRLRPVWSFALVGPVGPGDPRTDVSALRAVPNIHLLGARTYAQLPSVLRGADAALIPYAINDLTRSVFPMKVYEYLAAGLPVVATPLPAIAEVTEIHTAADAHEMAARLDRVLAEDTPALRRERSRAAMEHSWERRLEEIASAIASLPGGRLRS